MKPNFEKLSEKLNSIIEESIEKKNYEKALEAMEASSGLHYEWNQTYVDETLEEQLHKIKEQIKQDYHIFHKEDKKDNVIVFYDGVGADTRGLALIYLKNLVRLGFKVVYITTKRAINKQPEIKKSVENYDIEWRYISMENAILTQISELVELFNTYKPANAFFYSYPQDVAGTITFNLYNGVVTRFKINLTDHAYWLGTTKFDYCLEFRDYGAYISEKFRHIDKSKLIMLPYYPTIDKDIEFKGFPFEKKDNNKIIFSGGSLYKTLGEGNVYYQIIDHILEHCPNVIFLYAGSGDDRELKKLMLKYQNRVFHIDERKDLYQLMLHIDVYINTYPMIGGLMTQYAAMAGKIPLTLKHKDDGSGMLINQEKIGIEYDTKEELLEEAYKLLTDDNYKREKEKKLENSVISESQFREELNNVIKNHKSSLNINDVQIDTSEFLKSYVERYSMETEVICIANRKYKRLVWNFPRHFMGGVFLNLKRFFKSKV